MLRHYRRGGVVARFSRETYLWGGAERTRSFREFRMLQALRARGLPVPTPLAAAYWRRGTGYRAALLMLRLVETRSMGAFFDAGEAPPWGDIGRTIARFHRAGVCHADLNVDNVLMDASANCWLIDFDRSALRAPALGWQCANLARLRRSVRKRMGARADADEGANGWDASAQRLERCDAGAGMSYALRFLGVGNAAAVELGSSSVVLERDGAPLLMVDCGQEALTAYLEPLWQTPAAAFHHPRAHGFRRRNGALVHPCVFRWALRGRLRLYVPRCR